LGGSVNIILALAVADWVRGSSGF